MKRYFIFALALMAMLMAGCKQKSGNMAPDAPQKVDMKSVKAKTFIIQYKTLVKYKDLENVSHSTQWIDLENDRVAIENVSQNNMMGKDMKSRDLTIIKNEEAWVINLDQKLLTKRASQVWPA